MFRLMMGAMLAVLAWSAPAMAQNSANVAVGEPHGRGGDQGLPDDFRGRISYFGNHSGEVVSTLTWRGGPKKDCPRPDHRCPERIGGSLEVDLEFDGDIVKGTFRGTGGIRDSNLVGRRVGSTCRLYDVADGSVWAGRCDGYSFSGSVASVPNASVQVSLKFDAMGTKVRDYSEWDRHRRAVIMQRRHYMMLQAQLKGNGPIEQRFAAAVELNSFGWPYDQLQPNTITDIRRTKAKRGAYDISASFRLEGGADGWAKAHVVDEQISCIELWDAPGLCRPLNIPGPPVEPDPNPPADQQTSWLIPPAPALPGGDVGTMVALAARED